MKSGLCASLVLSLAAAPAFATPFRQGHRHFCPLPPGLQTWRLIGAART